MYSKVISTASLDSAEYRQARFTRSLSLIWLGQKTLQHWALPPGSMTTPLT